MPISLKSLVVLVCLMSEGFTLTSSYKAPSTIPKLHKLLSLRSTPIQSPPSQQKLKSPPSSSTYEKSNVWKGLTAAAKESVKRYFIHRATQSGIPWKEYYDLGASNMDVLLQNYIEISNPTIAYPEYYTQAFHSYAEGNLNWEAALEVVAATISISANYWPLADMESAQAWMRGNTTAAIQKHIKDYEATLSSVPRSTGKIMDVGCSVGASTKFLIEAFPEKDSADAVDLSPHFLSAAKFYHTTPESPMYTDLHEKISYHHAMAESLPFADESYDIVSISFLLHEIPTKTSEEAIAEAYRVLRPGGTLAIVDLSGKRIRNLPQPRKHFFELTEPLIRQYYKTDPIQMMGDSGFTFVETKMNDPMNALWIGTKPVAPEMTLKAQLVEAPVAITPLGRRLSAGAARIKSLIQNAQDANPSTSDGQSRVKEDSQKFTAYRFFLNLFTDEHLWNAVRWGSSLYFAALIFVDLIHLTK
jgi:ubiquinone/menaquinone biosynthesis C-methylase UbiE